MVFSVALLLVPFGVLASILFYVRFTLELTLDFSSIKLPKIGGKRRENTSWVVPISAPQAPFLGYPHYPNPLNPLGIP